MTHHILGYMIGLALGYWVLTHADKQKGRTKTVGMVVAGIIMAVSIIGPLCMGLCHLKCPSGSSSCPYTMKCPMDKGGAGMMDGQGMMGDKDKAK
jgi:hypothetical protein